MDHPKIGGVSNQKPLPREIYQRRRVAALVVVLVVVFGFIAIAIALFGGDDTNEAAESSTQEVTTEETTPETSEAESSESEVPESESEESESEEESASESEEPSVEAGAKDTCELSDLNIVASTPESTVSDGDLPTFYMTVENPTAADCVIDLDEDTLRFEVYNMRTNERIWSDVDCYAPVETGELTVEPGEDRIFEAEWSRLRSAEGECTNREPAGNGAYYLHAVIGDNPSEPTPFNLA
ncbi:Hypothetical protein NG00_01781 [Corynebacterium camporealensis]|uniref:Uncharacterized protein n=1 Tax=Corynebacterium camporealensis TaxID=161896 RepID=A0A0F6QXE2_9CORY|nr:hypothetical protein UL81_09940 [Corynebacterium camporealensis]AVH89020.1 Hypothetical protein NG00_01781 [Corynebacterium camporealensis]